MSVQSDHASLSPSLNNICNVRRNPVNLNDPGVIKVCSKAEFCSARVWLNRKWPIVVSQGNPGLFFCQLLMTASVGNPAGSGETTSTTMSLLTLSGPIMFRDLRWSVDRHGRKRVIQPCTFLSMPIGRPSYVPIKYRETDAKQRFCARCRFALSLNQ